MSAGVVDHLEKAVLTLTSDKLIKLRANIQERVNIKKWEQFLDKNYALYKL